MSQENNSDSKILLDNIESLMVQSDTTMHELQVDPDNPDVVFRVWVRELSFLEIQDALKEVMDIAPNGDVAIDMAAYWRYMLSEGVTKTEPQMSKSQLLSLRPEIAALVTSLLPQPQDLVVGPLVSGTDE